MPYAHLLVYIRQERESGDHEVVHVNKSQSSCLKLGPLLSKFQRINAHIVVQDEDEGVALEEVEVQIQVLSHFLSAGSP